MYRTIVVFLVVAILAGGWLSHAIHGDENAVQDVSDKRSPVPNADAQKQAKQLVLEVFNSQLAQAKSSQQKLQLAKDLLRLGAETNDDLASRFVLYTMASDMALETGDLETCWSAVRRLGEGYKVDTLPMKAELLAKIVKAPVWAKDGHELYPKFREVIEDALLLDRYDVAKGTNAQMLQWTQKLRDVETFKQVTALGKELVQLEAEYSKIKTALEQLKIQPNDASANSTVGRYRCFLKGDWENGLPFLVKGTDKTLSQLAADELLEAPDALQIGDAWWNVTQTLKGRSQEMVKEHARDWYRRLPPQTGLMKARLESRMGSTPGLGAGKPVAAKLPPSSTAETTQGASTETSIKEAIEATERIGGNLQNLIKQYTADAILIRGNRYKVFKETLTWNEAKDICAKLGGHLMVLEDGDERKAVGPINKLGLAWIGATLNRQGQPVWMNGAPFEFKLTQGDEEHPFIALNDLNFMRACTSEGKTFKGSGVVGFICEWEEGVVPDKKSSTVSSTTKQLIAPPKPSTPAKPLTPAAPNVEKPFNQPVTQPKPLKAAEKTKLAEKQPAKVEQSQAIKSPASAKPTKTEIPAANVKSPTGQKPQTRAKQPKPHAVKEPAKYKQRDWKNPEFLKLFKELTIKYTGGGYKDREFRYRLFVPDLKPGEKYPLIVWLHGNGQGGDDNAFHLCYISDWVLPPPWERAKYPYFVLSVQGPKDNQLWTTNSPSADDMLNVLAAVLDKTLNDYPIDTQRIALTGVSSGGTGCWELAMRQPERFCCLAPLGSNGADHSRLHLLVNLPVRSFHTRVDPAVPIHRDRETVAALAALGGRATLTPIDSNEHNCWDAAFRDHDLLHWLLTEHDSRPPLRLIASWSPWLVVIPLDIGVAMYGFRSIVRRTRPTHRLL